VRYFDMENGVTEQQIRSFTQIKNDIAAGLEEMAKEADEKAAATKKQKNASAAKPKKVVQPKAVPTICSFAEWRRSNNTTLTRVTQKLNASLEVLVILSDEFAGLAVDLPLSGAEPRQLKFKSCKKLMEFNDPFCLLTAKGSFVGNGELRGESVKHLIYDLDAVTCKFWIGVMTTVGQIFWFAREQNGVYHPVFYKHKTGNALRAERIGRTAKKQKLESGAAAVTATVTVAAAAPPPPLADVTTTTTSTTAMVTTTTTTATTITATAAAGAPVIKQPKPIISIKSFFTPAIATTATVIAPKSLDATRKRKADELVEVDDD